MLDEISVPRIPRYAYAILPIDFWDGWTRVENWEHQDRAQGTLKLAKAWLPLVGWEGDIREGPYLAPVVTGDSCDAALMVALKQDNNGDTFILSDHPLHLPDAHCSLYCYGEKPTYREYLQSPVWKYQRQGALMRADSRCATCGSAKRLDGSSPPLPGTPGRRTTR